MDCSGRLKPYSKTKLFDQTQMQMQMYTKTYHQKYQVQKWFANQVKERSTLPSAVCYLSMAAPSYEA